MTQRTVTLDDIYAPIQEPLQRVPRTILSIVSTANELLQEVVCYFFSSQGKLLRPALVLLGAGLKGGMRPDMENRLVHLAAGLEIFHAATLIHDDIIDSAYVRRNLPSLNVKWGPEIAVLVGDYLHDRAAEVIFQNANDRILSLFLQTAGIVCDGEIHELKEKNNFNLTEEEYFQIIEKKTAALLGCSIEAGAILAGATPEEAEALKRFGKYFGIAFQIVDDCLDFTAEEQEFGKTLGADCAAGVLTLPLIRLTRLVDERKKSDIFKIFKSEMGMNKFQTLKTMIREHDTIGYSMGRARFFCEKAQLELAVFPESPVRRSLENLVEYVIRRNR
jgi:octaprenyl-diphosphate synthase